MLMNEDSVLPDLLPDLLPARMAQLPRRGRGQGPGQGLPAGSRRCLTDAQSSLTSAYCLHKAGFILPKPFLPWGWG